MAEASPPPEFFQNVPIRPGEQILGYLPGLVSLLLPIQGGTGYRRDELQHGNLERATDLVGTDQRLLGFKVEEVKEFFTPKREFRVRFVAPLENLREIRARDNKLEFMAELTGMGLNTVYLVTGSTSEAEGLSRWLDTIALARRQRLGMAGAPDYGTIHEGGKTAIIRGDREAPEGDPTPGPDIDPDL